MRDKTQIMSTPQCHVNRSIKGRLYTRANAKQPEHAQNFDQDLTNLLGCVSCCVSRISASSFRIVKVHGKDADLS